MVLGAEADFGRDFSVIYLLQLDIKQGNYGPLLVVGRKIVRNTLIRQKNVRCITRSFLVILAVSGQQKSCVT